MFRQYSADLHWNCGSPILCPPSMGGHQTNSSAMSEEIFTEFSDELTILALRKILWIFLSSSISSWFLLGSKQPASVNWSFHGPLRPNCYNISSVTASSWPIQTHVATKALIPHCNVLDPPTSEEDATIHQIIRTSSPTNMNIHICNAEAWYLNNKHIMRHNHSYTFHHSTCTSSFINGKYNADTS